jgi:DNA-binding beta-propeller fold protein YncE
MQGGPDQIAFDANGNLYVADCLDSRVYRIDRSGKAFVVAGTGVQGFSGNGGPATQATFECPYGVALDKSGALYVTDHSSNRVREIGRDGVVHPFAGAGPIPLPGANGGSFAGDGGTRQHARFVAGRIYVADSANNRVRRIDRHSVITTYAGNAKIGYTGDGGPARAATHSDPFGLAFDAAVNLYVAEPDEGVIRKVDRRGIITKAAGAGKLGFSGDGGPATAARLNQPFGIAFDAKGDLFIADHDNGRLLRLDTKGIITTFFDGRAHT